MTYMAITGTKCPATGVWSCEHGHMTRVSRGDAFPQCLRCGLADAAWQYVGDAPGGNADLGGLSLAG